MKSINEQYGYKDGAYLFVQDGKRINQRSIASRIKRGCENIDMMVKTSHKIRKNVISTLIDKGINIDDVRRMAGHADERTTYNSYCFSIHSDKETERQLENALNHGANINIILKGNQGNQISLIN